MASDGITHKAKKGKCRICCRVRCTEKHVKAVGEVRHGFATGHIWECRDVEDCEKTAIKKLNDPKRRGVEKSAIRTALERGRFKEYTYTV